MRDASGDHSGGIKVERRKQDHTTLHLHFSVIPQSQLKLHKLLQIYDAARPPSTLEPFHRRTRAHKTQLIVLRKHMVTALLIDFNAA